MISKQVQEFIDNELDKKRLLSSYSESIKVKIAYEAEEEEKKDSEVAGEELSNIVVDKKLTRRQTRNTNNRVKKWNGTNFI